MEAIENESDRWMVDVADEVPGIPMIENVTPPGERLVADAHLPSGCVFSKLRQVVYEPRAITNGEWRTVRAEQDEVGSKLCHDVELALHALERARTLLRRHALEISEWLE